jgi:hypothetical protein
VGYFFGGETWTRILTEESFFGCVAKSIVTLSKSELATKLKVYLGAKKEEEENLVEMENDHLIEFQLIEIVFFQLIESFN